MANTKITTTIEAVDKASPVIKKVTGEMDKSKKSFKDFADEIPGLNQAMTLLANPVALAGAGIMAAGKFAADATKKTVEYNIAIDDLAQNLSITTEETSKIVQAMGDFGVEQANITDALQKALKNGFAPNIDTLAEMADKYVEIQDPTKRAAELTKVFGEKWTDLVPALRNGGDAIREAAATQSEALVVTAEAAQAARDYKAAMAELQEQAEKTQYAIGNKFLPPITAAIDLFNDATNGNEKLNKMTKAGIISVGEYSDIVDGLNRGTLSWAKANEILDNKMQHYNKTLGRSHDTVETLTEAGRVSTLGVYDAVEAEMRLAEKLERRATLNDDVARATEALRMKTSAEIIESNKNFDLLMAKMEEVSKIDLGTIDLGLASSLQSAIDEIDVQLAGGGAFDEAFATIKRLLKEKKITPEEAKVSFEDLTVSWQKTLVEAGLISATDAKKTIMDTLGVNWAEASKIFKELPKSAQDIMNGVTIEVRGRIAWESITQPTNIPNIIIDPKTGLPKAEAKAEGGPVSAGSPYWVGDGGEPELFVPNQNGTIIPQHDMQNGPPGGITLIFNGVTSAREIAQIVGRELDRHR